MMLDRSPLPRESLTTLIYQRLCEQLIAGRYRPSQKLKLRDVADELGTTPAPVREAIARLVADQALVQSGQTGIHVPVLDLARFIEVRDLRLALEGTAAARAAERATPNEIAQLARIDARRESFRAADERPQAMLQNIHFHKLLVDVAGLPVLARMVEGLWLQIGPTLHAPCCAPLARAARRHPHETILDGLRRRDPNLARRGMEDDILRCSQAVIESLRAEERETAMARGAASASEARAAL
jgi:DNA-binding GntR family transcriptional regulator